MSKMPWSRLCKFIQCAGLAGVVAGCAGPAAEPDAVSAPEPAKPPPPRAAKARPARCEQPARPRLTDAQKAALFQDFDDWQRQRDPAMADAPLPPPAPERRRTASRACRVPGA